MQETLRQNNYKVVRRHESNVWWCFTIISQGNYLCLLLKESRCLNRLSKIGMHFHQIFGGLFVWKISLTQPSVSQSQISIIAYMSGDCVMSTVPPRGFIWGEAIEGLESDWIFGGVRVVGDRALIESVAPENLRGEVRGPDLQQSVTDNPTLHNTIHNTILNEKTSPYWM